MGKVKDWLNRKAWRFACIMTNHWWRNFSMGNGFGGVTTRRECRFCGKQQRLVDGKWRKK